MKALILLGGQGTRLYPLTYKRPKCLLPILNRPLLFYILQNLKEAEVKDVLLLLGHQSDLVVRYIQEIKSDFPQMNISWVRENQQLGSGGAVKQAMTQIQDTCLVISGDSYDNLPLKNFLEYHKKHAALCTVALTSDRVTTSNGKVLFDQDYKVTHFHSEKSATSFDSRWINRGSYIVEPDGLAFLPEGYSSLSHDLIPGLLKQNQSVFAFTSDTYWRRIETIESYLSAQEDILAKQLIRPPDALEFNIPGSDVWAGKNTICDESVEIVGTVVIGDNCIIKSGVKIQGPTIIGNHCQIGQDAELSNTVLWDSTHIGKKAQLGACLVGSNSWLGDNCQIHSNAIVAEYCNIGEKRKLGIGEILGPHSTLMG